MKIVPEVNSKWKKKVFQQFDVWILHLKGHWDHSLKVMARTAWTCVCVFSFYDPNFTPGLRQFQYDLYDLPSANYEESERGIVEILNVHFEFIWNRDRLEFCCSARHHNFWISGSNWMKFWDTQYQQVW